MGQSISYFWRDVLANPNQFQPAVDRCKAIYRIGIMGYYQNKPELLKQFRQQLQQMTDDEITVYDWLYKNYVLTDNRLSLAYNNIFRR